MERIELKQKEFSSLVSFDEDPYRRTHYELGRRISDGAPILQLVRERSSCVSTWLEFTSYLLTPEELRENLAKASSQGCITAQQAQAMPESCTPAESTET